MDIDTMLKVAASDDFASWLGEQDEAFIVQISSTDDETVLGAAIERFQASGHKAQPSLPEAPRPIGSIKWVRGENGEYAREATMVPGDSIDLLWPNPEKKPEVSIVNVDRQFDGKWRRAWARKDDTSVAYEDVMAEA
jgi:hypothetical protein